MPFSFDDLTCVWVCGGVGVVEEFFIVLIGNYFHKKRAGHFPRGLSVSTMLRIRALH